MITAKNLFGDKVFATKEDLFKELRLNADRIIAVKKAEIYESNKKTLSLSWFVNKEGEASKVGPQMKEDCIYPVINTTNYLDSHDDVHWPGLWTKSIKEQQGKLYYVTDHKVETGTIIAWPSDVTVSAKTVAWGWVGKDYEGETEALIYEIPKAAIVHPVAKDIIEKTRPVQNSVRMRYVSIKLGMNSEAKEDIQYKEYFDSNVDRIANKEVAIENGYFFGVEEAKIILEGSMVIRGSNDATPIRQKLDEAVSDTSEEQPEKSTEPAFDLMKAISETKFI